MAPTSSADESDRARWIGETLERYEAPLVRYTAHITGDLDSARDVVQDAFLRLCRADRSKVEGRLAPWLYTVCRNRAIDIRRKEGRMQALDAPGQSAWRTVEPPPPDLAERHAERDRAIRALSSLPPRQQEVVRLKFQDGLSYKEIGQITGLSVTNVGYLIHVSIKAVREQLAADAGMLPEGQRSA